jgi:hypothetical protein
MGLEFTPETFRYIMLGVFGTLLLAQIIWWISMFLED